MFDRWMSSMISILAASAIQRGMSCRRNVSADRFWRCRNRSQFPLRIHWRENPSRIPRTILWLRPKLALLGSAQKRRAVCVFGPFSARNNTFFFQSRSQYSVRETPQDVIRLVKIPETFEQASKSSRLSSKPSTLTTVSVKNPCLIECGRR